MVCAGGAIVWLVFFLFCLLPSSPTSLSLAAREREAPLVFNSKFHLLCPVEAPVESHVSVEGLIVLERPATLGAFYWLSPAEKHNL